VEDLVLLLQETAVFLWKDWPRDMQVSTSNAQQNMVTLRGGCPHCKRDSVFLLVTNLGHGAGGMRLGGMQCQGCLAYILGIFAQLGNAFAYQLHYPIGKPDEAVADEIPAHIKPDYKEALRCLWVDAYNATAEMCRRALEASCIDLGAPSDKVLEKMIDWLETNRKITPYLKEAAHKIRLGGNRGAHPHPDGPEAVPVVAAAGAAEIVEKIGKEHAEAIVEFTREFFHHVYVGPKLVGKYDFPRQKATT